MKLKILAVLTLCFFLVSTSNLSSAATQPSTPIILVPGLGASWNFKEFLGYPKDEWGWMINAAPVYSGLIEQLNKAGYHTEDGTLGVAYYDWRAHLNVGAERVGGVITKTLDKYEQSYGTRPSSVDVVAHSMGGLVTKYKILTDENHRIRNFVTLGTPHQGLALAYFPWEGAEPYGWGQEERERLEIYTKLYGLTKAEINTISQAQKVFPGLQDLLPIYEIPLPNFQSGSYLWTNTNPPESVEVTAGMDAYNPILSSLLTLEKINGLSVNNYATVAGTGRDTIVKIFVNSNKSESKYPDGIPNKERTGYPDDGVFSEGEWEFPPEFGFGGLSGDGTVPAISASSPTANDVYLADGIDHTDLPSDPCVQEYIFDTLEIPWTYGDCELMTPPQIPADVAVFYAASPVTLRVKSPDGKIVDGDTNQIPGAEYLSSGGPDSITLITIPNPIAGNYQLSLTGIGDGGEYHTGGARFSEESSGSWQEASGSIETGESKTHSVTLTSKAPSPSPLPSPTPTPTATPQPTPTPPPLPEFGFSSRKSSTTNRITTGWWNLEISQVDEDGDPESVTVFNPNHPDSQPIKIKDWYLHDDSSDTNNQIVSNIALEPRSSVTLTAVDLNDNSIGSGLNNDHNTVYLKLPSGFLIDSYSW